MATSDDRVHQDVPSRDTSGEPSTAEWHGVALLRNLKHETFWDTSIFLTLDLGQVCSFKRNFMDQILEVILEYKGQRIQGASLKEKFKRRVPHLA